MTNLRARVEGILEAQFGTHIRESSDTTEGVLDCLKDNATNELISLLSEVLEECLPEDSFHIREDSVRYENGYDIGFNSCKNETLYNLKERMK